MKEKLQYVPKWKESPERVLHVMAWAPVEGALVETELQDRYILKETPKYGKSSNKKLAGSKGRRKDENRPKTPVTCFGCDKESHALGQREKSKAGGGNNGAKSKGAAGA